MDEQRRGIAAQQLLANEMLQEALANIEARLVDQLAQAEVTPERVARLQALLAAKRTFERYLRNVVSTGTMAAMDEEKRRKGN